MRGMVSDMARGPVAPARSSKADVFERPVIEAAHFHPSARPRRPKPYRVQQPRQQRGAPVGAGHRRRFDLSSEFAMHHILHGWPDNLMARHWSRTLGSTASCCLRMPWRSSGDFLGCCGSRDLPSRIRGQAFRTPPPPAAGRAAETGRSGSNPRACRSDGPS